MENQNIDELLTVRHHITGHAICCCCGHHWIAVYPECAKQLECPECEEFTQIKVFHGEITGVSVFPGRSSDSDWMDTFRLGIKLGKGLRKAGEDEATIYNQSIHRVIPVSGTGPTLSDNSDGYKARRLDLTA